MDEKYVTQHECSEARQRTSEKLAIYYEMLQEMRESVKQVAVMQEQIKTIFKRMEHADAKAEEQAKRLWNIETTKQQAAAPSLKPDYALAVLMMIAGGVLATALSRFIL